MPSKMDSVVATPSLSICSRHLLCLEVARRVEWRSVRFLVISVTVDAGVHVDLLGTLVDSVDHLEDTLGGEAS